MTDLDALAAAAEEAHVFGPDHEKLPFNECRYEPCVRRRAAVEERDRLRAALLANRHKDLPDGPCWCSVEPNGANNWTHVERCRLARAALYPEDGT